MVLEPKQFGRTSLLLQPLHGVEVFDPRFLAAQLQHRVANVAREAILADGQTFRSYADLFENVPGMTYERLVRIQRGESLMQIADLMAWAVRFDAVRQLLTDVSSWPQSSVPEDSASGTALTVLP